MNTIVHYMYRDAANYKIHCKEIVKGELDEIDRKDLFENYEEAIEFFYPEKIGFKAPTFVSEGYRPYEDDPDSHEIVDFELTDERPTVDLTIDDVLAYLRGKRKFFLTDLSFDVTDEDLDLDPEDFGPGSDYYEACRNKRMDIYEDLPTQMIIALDEEDIDEDDLDCEICDRISDRTGWLVNDGFRFREL